MTVGDRRLDGRGLILIKVMKFIESSTNILTVRLVCVVGGFVVSLWFFVEPRLVAGGWLRSALVGDLCPSGFKKVGPVPGEGFLGGEVLFGEGDLLALAGEEEKPRFTGRDSGDARHGRLKIHLISGALPDRFGWVRLAWAVRAFALRDP